MKTSNKYWIIRSRMNDGQTPRKRENGKRFLEDEKTGPVRWGRERERERR